MSKNNYLILLIISILFTSIAFADTDSKLIKQDLCELHKRVTGGCTSCVIGFSLSRDYDIACVTLGSGMLIAVTHCFENALNSTDSELVKIADNIENMRICGENLRNK